MWPLDGRSPSGGWERIAGSAHAACHHTGPLPPGLDIQLIAQTFIYYSIVIFGLLVAVPVGITTKKFGGWCILYGDVTDDKLTFGASVYCHYVTYVNVLISVVYGGVLAVSHTVAVIRNIQGAVHQLSGVRSPIWSIVLLGCNTIVTLLSLGSACILTVGFQRWCSSLLSNARLHHGYHLQSCSEAEHLEWENVDGSSFYACYSIATASAWLSLFAWLIQTSLNLLVFIRLKKDEFGLSVLDSADNSPVHEPVLPRSSSPERY